MSDRRPAHPEKLRHFIAAFTCLTDRHHGDEARMIREGSVLLQDLVAHDDWLPEDSAAPDAAHYQQHLLWCDPLERFSVVSFVWGPGQQTPVHDHTVWGLIGMLRGQETQQRYARDSVSGRLIPDGEATLFPGQVAAVSPSLGDIHVVRNALADSPSISIHVYGANIGAVRRHVFDIADAGVRSFTSGYSSVGLPNVWDRSKEDLSVGR